jgi:hypothetical protein
MAKICGIKPLPDENIKSGAFPLIHCQHSLIRAKTESGENKLISPVRATVIIANLQTAAQHTSNKHKQEAAVNFDQI